MWVGAGNSLSCQVTLGRDLCSGQGVWNEGDGVHLGYHRTTRVAICVEGRGATLGKRKGVTYVMTEIDSVSLMCFCSGLRLLTAKNHLIRFLVPDSRCVL